MRWNRFPFTRRFLSAAVVALITLAIGIVVGRTTASDQQYGPISDRERLLLGQWKMTVNGGEVPFRVEFRPDRTAIQYSPQGRPDTRATWGIVGSELSFQNGQNVNVTGGYMPPVVMVVTGVEENSLRLESRSGTMRWQLERL